MSVAKQSPKLDEQMLLSEVTEIAHVLLQGMHDLLYVAPGQSLFSNKFFPAYLHVAQAYAAKKGHMLSAEDLLYLHHKTHYEAVSGKDAFIALDTKHPLGVPDTYRLIRPLKDEEVLFDMAKNIIASSPHYMIARYEHVRKRT